MVFLFVTQRMQHRLIVHVRETDRDTRHKNKANYNPTTDKSWIKGINLAITWSGTPWSEGWPITGPLVSGPKRCRLCLWLGFHSGLLCGEKDPMKKYQWTWNAGLSLPPLLLNIWFRLCSFLLVHLLLPLGGSQSLLRPHKASSALYFLTTR